MCSYDMMLTRKSAFLDRQMRLGCINVVKILEIGQMNNNILSQTPAFDPVRFDEHVQRMSPPQVAQEIKKLTELIKRTPRNGDFYLALGLLEMRANYLEDALGSLKKALKFSKNQQPIFAKITEILVARQYKFSEAVPYYKKWVKAANNAVPVLTRLARCELAANRLEDALATMKRAENRDPNDPVIFEVYATIYAKHGDSVQTRAALQRCLELGGNIDVTSRLLTLPGSSPTPELIKQFAEMSTDRVDPERRLHLHTNIGLAHETRDEYEQAFEHFRKANDFVKERLNKEREFAPFANIKDAFSQSVLLRNEGRGHSSDRPVFIVGMPRSGTTLIESILAAHPQITDNGELPFVYDLLKKFGAQKVPDMFGSSKTPSLKYLMENATPDSFAELAGNYLSESGYQNNLDCYQVDKLPHNFFSVGFIHLMFPDAKIIHSRRHPVDCALSCYKSSFSEFHAYATDLEFLGAYYQKYWELMKYWREVLPGRMYEVCYEDTVVNTEQVARGMINHIGLEWDEACLDHTRSKKTVSTASQWQVRQPVYTSSVAKWKNYENELQPMIKAMGSCVAEYEAELAELSG